MFSSPGWDAFLLPSPVAISVTFGRDEGLILGLLLHNVNAFIDEITCLSVIGLYYNRVSLTLRQSCGFSLMMVNYMDQTGRDVVDEMYKASIACDDYLSSYAIKCAMQQSNAL